MGKTLFSHKCYEKKPAHKPMSRYREYVRMNLITASDSQACVCLLLVLTVERGLHHDR